MNNIFDKVKAAGLGTVVVAAGAWLVATATNWLKLKGVPEDVVFAIGTFLGGLVATGAAYLKVERSGSRVSNERGQSLVAVLLIVFVVIAIIVLLGGRG